MKLSLFSELKSQKVIDLYKRVFAASEGEAEGQVIADFVAKLIATTKSQDLIGCVAEENQSIIGCIFFSRFIVPSGEAAYILSPVAVSTSVQGTGIGQKLIQYGLSCLRSKGVKLAFTYGDPNYYSKTGFKKIDESIVKAPYPLSQPNGWLAQSLDGDEIKVMLGSTLCVEALNESSLW